LVASVRGIAAAHAGLPRAGVYGVVTALEAYFEASGVQIPIDLVDLAGSLTALARGLSLQKPPEAPGSASNAGRVIDNLLRALALKRPKQKVG
jgi:hypothetical protein